MSAPAWKYASWQFDTANATGWHGRTLIFPTANWDFVRGKPGASLELIVTRNRNEPCVFMADNANELVQVGKVFLKAVENLSVVLKVGSNLKAASLLASPMKLFAMANIYSKVITGLYFFFNYLVELLNNMPDDRVIASIAIGTAVDGTGLRQVPIVRGKPDPNNSNPDVIGYATFEVLGPAWQPSVESAELSPPAPPPPQPPDSTNPCEPFWAIGQNCQ